LNFKVENNKNHILIRCKIEKLDAIVSPELKAIFLHHSNDGIKNFIVDLSEVIYCDSSGLSSLLVGNRILKEKVGFLIIFGLNPMVEKIINISQLDTVLKIYDNENNALKNIK
jgi:anti-sigma B factor antagonist